MSLSLSDNGKDESIPYQTDSQDLELYPSTSSTYPPSSPSPKLVRLELNLTTPVRVSPEDISSMAAAWTQIVALDVLPIQTCYGRLPLIKPHSRLEPPSRLYPSSDEKTKRYDNLGCLLVGESPICSPSRVVKFIRRAFPKLQELYVEYDECAWKKSIQRKRWAAVREELGLATSQGGGESQRTADPPETQFSQGFQYSQTTDESQTTEGSEDMESD
ncbi:hypothetical protein FA13DRAFT_1803150 [Coprinellus micaceus]|uniref:Uncharacterized protein n=1 Tax=Coprinellus micaceus TaxID=71717 RepID=A0A4Y7SCR8_COPMI|nr:hypothetical protein FA13DRAFT_1803150 [Coprinellus micaceus]